MLVSDEAVHADLDMSYGTDKGSRAPANLRIMLFVGDPSGDGVELGPGGGYVAPVVPNNGTTWPDPAAVRQKVSAPIEFPDSTDAWDDVPDWWAIADDDTDAIWDAMPIPDGALAINEAGVTNITLQLVITPNDL